MLNFLRKIPNGKIPSGRLARNGMASLFIYGARIALQMATGILLARLLGPEAMGHYAFVIAIVTMAATPAQFGMTTLLLRETAIARALKDSRRLIKLWRISLMTSGLGILTITALLVFGGWGLGGSIPALEPISYFWGILLVPIIVASNLGEAALQGLGQPVKGALPVHIIRSVLFLIGLGIFSFTSVTLVPIDAIGLQIACHTVGMTLVLLFWQQEGARELRAMPSVQSSASSGSSWLRSAASFVLIHGMWIVLSNTDLIMLGILSDAKQVAFYRVASSAAIMVFISMQALNPIVCERMSWFHARGDRAGLQRVAKLGGAAAFAVALPLMMIFALWGERVVVLLFGLAYGGATTPLVILAAGQTAHIAAGYAPSLLGMAGVERINLFVLSGAAVLNLVLNFVLIPIYGASGAAVATATAIILQTWVMWAVVRWRMGIETSLLSWVLVPRLQPVARTAP